MRRFMTEEDRELIKQKILSRKGAGARYVNDAYAIIKLGTYKYYRVEHPDPTTSIIVSYNRVNGGSIERKYYNDGRKEIINHCAGSLFSSVANYSFIYSHDGLRCDIYNDHQKTERPFVILFKKTSHVTEAALNDRSYKSYRRNDLIKAVREHSPAIKRIRKINSLIESILPQPIAEEIVPAINMSIFDD